MPPVLRDFEEGDDHLISCPLYNKYANIRKEHCYANLDIQDRVTSMVQSCLAYQSL